MATTDAFQDYTLYYNPYCPFCVKVERALKSMNIQMEMRDIMNPDYRNELIAGGGRATVPCLKHPDGTWQYESDDIIAHIKARVS